MPSRYTLNRLRFWSMVAIVVLTSSTILLTTDRRAAPVNGPTAYRTATTDPHSPHQLIKRVNNGNDATPNWLGYQPSELSKPGAQPDAKGRAVIKGYRLSCMLKAGVSSVAASIYQSIDDMIKFGWRASFVDRPDGAEFAKEYGLTKGFTDLRIPVKGWTQISTGNTIDVLDPEDNKKMLHPATFATYTTDINLAAGAIVASQSYNPEFMATKYPYVFDKGGTLTPLSHVSDLLFLSWKKLIRDRQTGNLQNLEHMFRWNSEVEEVQQHLKMAAGGKDIKQIGEWPGVSFPITELQALATLSAGNAQGVAWLLGQHKHALGVKTVDRVNIFNCPAPDGKPQWCVYLHIVPVQ
ncbi:hypothetical protein CBER1_06970 [Cercospora berteroae]|uniref:Uncharacterized protein n=1 Tax=Cercospora berteroae TaxID=357750 RepID=A0A2S6BSF8_9PEZI|nr:hypothetical protein CBER1_06970 [Cercospora berteroae]